MIALIFDTETTGLVENRSVKLEKQPHIIEFFAQTVDLASGEVTLEVEMLIKPPEPVSAEITKITSITNELLADAKPFSEYAEAIKKLLEAAPVVIAHNLSFDSDMIEIEFERLGQTIAWPRKICTVEATISVRGYRLNLGKLHQWLFNEPMVSAHRARADVTASTRCCVELFKRGMI